MKRLRPKNWNEFQHYKRRHPPWVKLHKRLLDDFEFQSLPLASKALAPMLWLLASEDRQGWIDAEAAKISFRLRISEEDLEQAIRPLIEGGFFEHEEDASAALALDMQEALPESETESEEETEELSDPPSGDADPCDEDFQIFWKDYPTDALMSKKRAGAMGEAFTSRAGGGAPGDPRLQGLLPETSHLSPGPCRAVPVAKTL